MIMINEVASKTSYWTNLNNYNGMQFDVLLCKNFILFLLDNVLIETFYMSCFFMFRLDPSKSIS